MSEEKLEFKPLDVSEREYKKRHKKDPRPNNPKEGRALKGWSTFFFVLSIISLALVASSFALPLLIVIVGVLAAMLWLVWFLFGSIITLGMMWLSDETKKFNQWCLDTMNKIFDAANNSAELGMKIVPIVVIVGAALFLITWTFMIIGFNVDKVRHKHYKGMLIALGVITGVFILLAILALIVIFAKQ